LVTVASLLATTALLVAAAALVKARRTARRLERLTESYWELRYEYGQLRSRLDRLDPGEPAGQAAVALKSGGATQSFVPLSSLKSRP
jgi:hypothetical protein